MEPEAPERPPIDPRFRARQLEVARQAGRRRLKWILVLVAIVVLLVGGALLIRAPFLSVDQVDVSGAVYTDRAVVADIVEELQGEPMLTLDTGAVARKLEALPWVLKARVERDWPRAVRVELAERTPLAVYGASDGIWRVVDEEGRVLTTLEGRPVEVLLLNGPGPALQAGDTVSEPLAGAVRIARALPLSLRARTLELAFTQNGEYELHLQPKGTVVLGTADDIRDKLIATLTVLAKVDPKTLETLDVRSPANPVTKPSSAASLTGTPS